MEISATCSSSVVSVVHNQFHLKSSKPFSSSSSSCKLLQRPILNFPTLYSSSSSSSSSITFGISISDHQYGYNSIQRRIQRSRRRRRRIGISAVFERFTERAIKAVVFSQREARSLGKDMVFTQHILLGLIAEDRSPNGYLASGITLDKAIDAVRTIWNSDSDDDNAASKSKEPAASSSFSSSDTPFSISSKRVFEAAVEYSRSNGYNFIAPDHISIALFTSDDGSAARVLKRLGADINQLGAVAVSRLQGELAKDGREPLKTSSSSKSPRKKNMSDKTASVVRSSEKKKEKSALEQFCIDLTARANEGKIDPVIARDDEVQRIVQILCRRTKKNPILLGEPGVGKTAIAEGLATSIVDGDVPPFLLTKRVLSLDIGLLMAGAKERGELESRVTNLISEILKEGNVILFIDEVHTLIGSGTVGRGSKGSGLDIANLLKPALGRGELQWQKLTADNYSQCIASTTLDEHRSIFEKDKALARRFQPVFINEPREVDAIKILLGLQEKYAAHHKCRYTPEAINAAVYLSARYISDRYLPDKAIDLMDEAGSRARIDAFRKKKEQQTIILSKSPNDYWQEIRAVQSMHEVVLANKSKYGFGDSSPDEENVEVISEPLVRSTSDVNGDDELAVVGIEEIASVASLWSGVPVQQLTADERLRLVDLDEQLKKRVVGQDEAVVAISRAVKRSRVGLKDPNRPIAAMLFCGPTGVGKTELTKALAACYFGSEETMLRLDMSEYMERHSVSKLIGSPPGYVGYGDGGVLTEAIRRKPFTVVLLDEIEKAHPDIFNILLQVFEDGHLTDSQGRRVSFKNTLIVMTSNVGSSAIAKGRRNSIGFILDDDDGKSGSYAAMKALLMEELKAYFRPELLNRLDEVVVFRPLETTQMVEIVSIMLKEVKERLMSLGIGLEISEAIVDLVCRQGYDRSYGARPLRRAITHLIEDVLSEAVLAGDCKPGDTAVIDVDAASGKPFVTALHSDQTSQLSDATSMT
ncbi:hypothetical protein C5167_022198 [Papaver somniferum]|uniref:Clp R domain-containing protein n=1 Tax=Papaver somniferum TaxID=3469 RepID=A0A4Y7JL83_PAPSO|nr:hypothetical protein C5167_022198 [Papaver somniferum]